MKHRYHHIATDLAYGWLEHYITTILGLEKLLANHAAFHAYLTIQNPTSPAAQPGTARRKGGMTWHAPPRKT